MKRNINLLLDSKVYKDCNRFLNVISHPFSVQVSASSEKLFLSTLDTFLVLWDSTPFIAFHGIDHSCDYDLFSCLASFSH